MLKVRPKKHLGQHFLTDESVASNIATSLTGFEGFTQNQVLEIGPGTGFLTKYLVDNEKFLLKVCEIDRESEAFLNIHYPKLEVVGKDFLKVDIGDFFSTPYAIIGNFPYNISSQIFFKILENKEHCPITVCMIQKEVAERMAAKHGNKTYGILSVLMQAFFDIEYLFTVNEDVFNPPPKVKSAVIRIVRNSRAEGEINEKRLKQVVKMAFNNRRKTMRNSLKALGLPDEVRAKDIFDKRPEQLSVQELIDFSRELDQYLD